jgi:hypothetical protein
MAVEKEEEVKKHKDAKKHPSRCKKWEGCFLIFPIPAYQGLITSIPPIHGRSTSGTTMEPSACW